MTGTHVAQVRRIGTEPVGSCICGWLFRTTGTTEFSALLTAGAAVELHVVMSGFFDRLTQPKRSLR